MYLISHRGNLTGPDPKNENTPEYIDEALKHVHCEVDVWRHNGALYLGHDEPQHIVPWAWFMERESQLIVHCKNIEALCLFQSTRFHYFWHDEDDYTLTSWGYIWAYPNKPVINKSLSIAVMPELHNTDVNNFLGVCTDEVLHSNL